MRHTFVVSDETVNRYGFWVATAGIELDEFEQNPVMLYMHARSGGYRQDEVLPIGYWENVRVEEGRLLADAVFDMDDPFAAKIAKKVENKVLRAASIGFTVVETSEDPAKMKPGQTRPTITRAKLREISIVDMPANTNAVRLYDQNGLVNLSAAGALPDFLPKTSNASMEIQNLVAGFLGLGAQATLADIQTRISALHAKAEQAAALQVEVNALRAEREDQRTKEANRLMDAATEDGRLDSTQRVAFTSLFAANFDAASAALAALKAVPKLVDITQQEAKGAGGVVDGKLDGKTFEQLRAENPNKLVKLKTENPEAYEALKKAQYGK